MGIPHGDLARLAVRLVGPALRAGCPRGEVRPRLQAIAKAPAEHQDDLYFGQLAQALTRVAARKRARRRGLATVTDWQRPREPRESPAPFAQWGTDLDAQSLEQMSIACQLPVSVRGALMPDAHVGYGLPIGGVLATDNAVIPYAVGVDIACRMKLTVLDLPAEELAKHGDRLVRAIEQETCFGIGGEFSPGQRRQHAVMDRDWNVSPITSDYKDKAAAQLGTSGSGNHFVEFGLFTLEQPALGLDAGQYLALLSHSGSRGTGAAVCGYYAKLATQLHPEVDKALAKLAWLDLDSHTGQEYWLAMQLMGAYASANHACIHDAIVKHLGARAVRTIENHHNFAWIERHDAREVIVHRKGATPAGPGVIGIIPGSMASPAYVVQGKGSTAAMDSAAHGAGRVMSRREAKRTFQWSHVRHLLNQRGIRLLSAGLDEVPMVYKDLDQVMAAQRDLVQAVARFDPKIVKMAPEGERPED